MSLAAGCSRDGTEAGKAEQVPIASNGFQHRSFNDRAGNAHAYVVFVPQGYRPKDKLPVLLFLNGLGENGDDGVKQISNNFGLQIWEMRQFFPFLAVAPQCRREGNWSVGSQDTEWALEILESVIDDFGADRGRVYLTGVSSGGSGVWNLATLDPERFAGIVPLCGGDGADPPRLADARLPVWDFYNELDGANVVNPSRTARKRFIELGQSPLVTEYHDLGHDCWNRAYRSTAMYAWLLAQSREKNRAESRFEYWPGDRLVRQWRHEGGGEWTVDADGVVVGRMGGRTNEDGASRMGNQTERGERKETIKSTQDRVQSTEHDFGERRGVSPPVAAWPGSLASNAVGQNVEIHADVWLEGRSEVRMGVVNARALVDGEDEGSSVDQARREVSDLFVSVVMPDVGAGGLVTGDGRWMARLDPGAQRTLRANAWNDVRVRLKNGRVTIHLNGWAACDLNMHGDKQAAVVYRGALVMPSDGSEGRWRFVRVRILGEDGAATVALGGDDEVRPESTFDEKEFGQVSKPAPRNEGRSETVLDVHNPWQAGKPTLGGVEQILGDWGERESRMASRQFEWQVVRRNQSATFGAVAGSENTAVQDDPSALIHIVFDNRGFRLDGESIPSVGLSKRAGAAASGSTGAAAEHAQFQAALRSRFSDAGASMPEDLTSVPYRVLVDSVREVHAWERKGECYPRAIVFAPGTAERTLGTDSFSAVLMNSGIVNAYQMAMRPLNSTAKQRTAERFRILPDRPVVDGEPCVIVEERRGESWDAQTRRLWVDPSRSNVIVRCLHTVQDKLDGPQYDIEYDRDETGLWLPRTISVLRVSSLGDPQDAISIVRRPVTLIDGLGAAETGATIGTGRAAVPSPDSEELFAWEPAPGTWVDDYIENRQYFVRADGSRRNIAFSENYAGLTYADLRAEGSDGWTGLGVATLRFRSSIAAFTKKAVTWPGILLTLPALYFLWNRARVGYNRWRRTGF